MSYPLKLVRGEDRPCGSCQECCRVVGVEATDAPPGVPCRHQCAAGCAIYADRPEECRTYHCLWQSGQIEGDERRRPDNLGILFDYRIGTEFAISAWECRPGAAQEPQARYVLEKMASRALILLRVHDGGFRMMGRGAEKMEVVMKEPLTPADRPLG